MRFLPKIPTPPKTLVEKIILGLKIVFGLLLCTTVFFLIVWAARTCGDGCKECWDKSESFFGEFFNSNPRCFECENVNEYLSND